MSTLDLSDIRILDALQEDGRLTNQALADKVGMSTSPSWRKVRKLEEDGIIAGYRATLDRKAIGLGVMAFVRIKIESHSEAEAEQFAAELMGLEEVITCYSIAGDADFLLQVVSHDLDTYADFAMSTLRRLPSIKEMQTTFVLKETKSFKGFPLKHTRSVR
ncbi:Lrp/AsnC family transcriptional regulator [Brucella thiophenivorans]|uniref:AsnC family protein n=1 Tax=Brucella thiophenivorans TaxID=571255 RepID=A0A256F109_9HYPH|nr:Lrp/AsnC family transcriptional regulator [Brucella thiophenivorans]OYR08525.1 asnC family protein [Brucella thiophenivorans]